MGGDAEVEVRRTFKASTLDQKDVAIMGEVSKAYCMKV